MASDWGGPRGQGSMAGPGVLGAGVNAGSNHPLATRTGDEPGDPDEPRNPGGLHPSTQRAAENLGIAARIEALRKSAELSARWIAGARSRFTADQPVESAIADVVAFGSLARQELTAESDLDYLVVAIGMPRDPRGLTDLLLATDGMRRELAVQAGKDPGGELRKPGASGVFGCVVSSVEITERIGLQDDTNHNQTRRLELIQESVSLLSQDVYDEILDALLSRYLHPFLGEVSPDRVPRFLLNDVIRYWRTITVDYQAKVWSTGDDWGLRYLKLIIPRKLTYAGTLASLLACGLLHSATVEDLRVQLAMPPLARLAQLEPHLSAEGKEALARVLLAANSFIECSERPEWRDSVSKVRDRRNLDPQNRDFMEAREMARNLQADLGAIFFGDKLLRDRSIDYLGM